VQVREVMWSLKDLRGFVRQVRDDAGWFASIRAQLAAAEVSEIDNGVYLEVRSKDPKVVLAIREHFGDPGWLDIKWFPTEWDGPRGELVVLVQNQDGEPLPHMRCAFTPEDPSVLGEGTGYSNEDGRCTLPRLPAVSYVIEIAAPTGETDTVVAAKRADVVPDTSTVVRVVVRQ
jgi:hypothetical protein